METVIRLEAEYKQKYENSLEKILFYQEQEEDIKCLDEAIEALGFLTSYQHYFEAASNVRDRNSGGRGNLNFANASNINVLLFDLFQLFTEIFINSINIEDTLITTYIAEKICLIVEEIEKHKEDFNVDQTRNYEDILLLLKQAKSYVKNGQEILTKIGKTTPENTENQRLQKIRVSLKKISSAKSCPIEFEKTDGCFIATAVYEAPEHPDLDVFRDFRDNQLLTNSFGKWLVSIYYKIGPSLAQCIASQPKLKNFTHERLKYLAQWMRK